MYKWEYYIVYFAAKCVYVVCCCLCICVSDKSIFTLCFCVAANCFYSGKYYDHGEVLSPRVCVTCTCDVSMSSSCLRELDTARSCPVLSCPPVLLVVVTYSCLLFYNNKQHFIPLLYTICHWVWSHDKNIISVSKVDTPGLLLKRRWKTLPCRCRHAANAV